MVALIVAVLLLAYANGAIFGIGMWTGNLRWRLVATIVLAWIATLPMATLLAFGLGKAFSMT